MSEGRKCGGCGARVTRDEAKFCEYCGAELPLPAPAAPVEMSPSEQLDLAFRALADHPEYPHLIALTPRTSGPMMGYGCGVAFGIVFLVISLVVFGGFSTVGSGMGMPSGFSLFPLLFVGIGLFVVIFSIVKAVKYSGAPLARRRAHVVGERTRVSGGGQNSSASTSYYVTLEFKDGRRSEYKTSGRILGEVSEGDMGVAYVKGGHLLSFERLRV